MMVKKKRKMKKKEGKQEKDGHGERKGNSPGRRAGGRRENLEDRRGES